MDSALLDTAGGVHRPNVLSAAELDRLDQLFPERIVAGVRLGAHGLRDVADLVSAAGPIGRQAAEVLGGEARPVRALLFDKTSDSNWSLAWHQDRTICVREKKPSARFTTWSVKSGLNHVEPPFDIIEDLITVRVHLDKVDELNAPLRIIPGSHRQGRLDELAIQLLARSSETATCLADRGDLWIYWTAVVHASGPKTCSGRRRVLQLDYAAGRLPSGLEWVGLC